MTWSERLDRIPQTIIEKMVMEFVSDGSSMDEANRRIEKPWLYERPFQAASAPATIGPSDGNQTGSYADPFAPTPGSMAPAPSDPFAAAPGGMAPAPAAAP